MEAVVVGPSIHHPHRSQKSEGPYESGHSNVGVTNVLVEAVRVRVQHSIQVRQIQYCC